MEVLPVRTGQDQEVPMHCGKSGPASEMLANGQ